MPHYSIAIDGPAGAGKSTLARALADALGFLYVDTGAIYRTLALHMLRSGTDISDAQQVVFRLSEAHVDLCHGEDGAQQMLLGGEDVSRDIRDPQVSAAASAISALPPVRAHLLEMQRRLAREHNVVMDGRDIGTVVLPQADLKIFLTAKPEIRARRRHLELAERGVTSDFAQVLTDLNCRDWNDSHRPVAPLRQAEDGVLVDTSDCDLDESLARLLTLAKERLSL